MGDVTPQKGTSGDIFVMGHQACQSAELKGMLYVVKKKKKKKSQRKGKVLKYAPESRLDC